MKAQRVRRVLWFANVALALGVVAVGVLAFLAFQGKGGSAGQNTAWADAAVKEYDKRPDLMMKQPAVKIEEVETVFLNAEWKDRWFPFTGPRIPPKVDPVKQEVEVPKGPTGLEALGRVRMVAYHPPGSEGKSAILFEFAPDKKSKTFVVDEFIALKGQRQRFKLIAVERTEPGVSAFNLRYEVYDDPAGKPVKADVLLFDAQPKRDPKGGPIVRFPGQAPATPPVPEAGTPGAGVPAAGTAPKTAVAPGSPAAGTTPPVAPLKPSEVVVVGGAGGEDWKPTIRKIDRTRYQVEMADDAYAALQGKSVEKIIEDVRTEPFNEGGVRGLRVFPGGTGNVAEKFDVRRGDILISINGQPTPTREDAIRVARGIPADTARVSVVLDRDGERLTYDVDPRDPKVRRAAASAAPR